MGNLLEPQPRGLLNGWWPIYDYSILTTWLKRGDAVSLGDDYKMLLNSFDHSECIIRVHRVTTLQEYAQVTEAYRALSNKYSAAVNLTCLFRGQSRDYYSGNTLLAPTPFAFRSDDISAMYLYGTPSDLLAAEWDQWTRVIKEITGEDDVTGALYWFNDPYQPERKVVPAKKDKRLSARLATNLFLMALAMHYGFPTLSLDVTPNHTVALWFALHQGERDENGFIHYIANQGIPGTLTGPSVYIYLQQNRQDHPTIDLTALEALQGKAHRPFVQSAWSLPFYTHGISWMGDMDPRFYSVSGPSLRWPTAIIKPEFPADELQRAKEMYSAKDLFPPTDPLYQALIAAKVPRLAIYAL